MKGGAVFFVLCLILVATCTTHVEFGREAKLKWFKLTPDELYINHGSYGATLIPVLNAQANLLQMMQKNPLRFLAHEYPVLLNTTRDKLAKYVNADKDDVVFIENASNGVNSVLRSWPYAKGDKILVTSLGYNAVRTTIQFLIDQYEIQVVTVPITLPTNRESIIKSIRDVISTNNIRYAVLDHISSFPTIEFPLKEIIPIMRSSHILTLIDGAHALGQIPLNLKELDPDYYLSNSHKWLCGSYGSAFLYIKKSMQSQIHPAVISHFYKQGFQTSFAWTGTRDYTSILAMSAALDFRHQITDRVVWDYNNGLCRRVATFMFDRWNTTTIAPMEMMNSMINVRMPCNVPQPECWNYNIEELQKQMETDHNVWTFLRKIDGIHYVRISCQIYNEFGEFEKLIKIIEQVQDQFGNKSH
jgi:selenocysteine lyase/cysteine desulfurase